MNEEAINEMAEQIVKMLKQAPEYEYESDSESESSQCPSINEDNDNKYTTSVDTTKHRSGSKCSKSSKHRSVATPTNNNDQWITVTRKKNRKNKAEQYAALFQYVQEYIDDSDEDSLNSNSC